VAAKKKLARVAETTVWTKGVFGPDKFTIEALAEQAQKVDFAVMVFGPDDVIFSRGNRFEGPRDNVIFELGLFMGALSRKRAFVISPREKNLKVPSDLRGINFVNYNSRPKQHLPTSVNNACDDINKVIREHGPI
jgi:CRP/FNR family cyclic AMP-dependent transcriptional regulator